MCHQFKGYWKTLGLLFTYVCILDIAQNSRFNDYPFLSFILFMMARISNNIILR